MVLTRRAVLEALPALSALSFLGGCRQAPTAATKPTWPRTTVHEGVEMIELFPNDADESSPIVVAVHGRGDRPDRWVDDWKRFPAKVRITLPRAPDPLGDGFSWFEFKDGMTDEQFGEAVGTAEARLWKGIVHLGLAPQPPAKVGPSRRMLVTGFSQGGILSFAMAARHGDAIAQAFPVAGSCPGPLLPKEKTRAAPVLAFHGTGDRVIEIKWSRETVNAFKERGNQAELREYDGVGHTMTPRIHEELWAAMTKALPAS
jgi:phospholipase/carboxylesterase